MEDWLACHRSRWHLKAALRRYYQREIFSPLLAAVGRQGPLLEIGAGPGFFREYAAGQGTDVFSVDIDSGASADVCCDVHALPFVDACFSGVAGVDVLHHIARPAVALREMARVLRPGGRLALVEPWTGVAGWFFYRFVHHEGCYSPADPLGEPFGAAKSPMEGNARIPKLVLWERREDLSILVPELRLGSIVPFAGLSYLLTGGFQRWGAPEAAVMALAWAESKLPRALMRHVGVRALFVFERL